MASLATCIPVQLGIARYLERGSYERHLRALRQMLQESRDQTIDAISRFFRQARGQPSGRCSYFLWIELPDNIDAMSLQRQAMA